MPDKGCQTGDTRLRDAGEWDACQATPDSGCWIVNVVNQTGDAGLVKPDRGCQKGMPDSERRKGMPEGDIGQWTPDRGCRTEDARQ